MLYVLPYGQMSLWGATVITNLLSAIPWIGQDFVQLVYTNTIDMSTALPIIGTINWVLDAGQKARSSEQLQQFLTIPHSFLAQLAGLIDGVGYIAITKTTNPPFHVVEGDIFQSR